MSDTSTPAVGPYPVDVVVGSGSFGTVYRGWHPVTGDLLAIKVLDPERHVDPGAVRRRLHAEAAAMRAVSDPHCVRVWDVVDLPDRSAIVSDFIDGVSVRAVLRSRERLDGPQALGVLLGLLHGLGAVHRAGLVHGDVKPENVLVDRTGTSRLIDFGLTSPTRRNGAMSGTPAYQSPEQIRGVDVDARSDLFSVGVMLYELLCGRRPFQATSVAALYDLHLHADPPDPRVFQPDLVDDLALLCLAGLARDPALRPQTAVEFLARLERAAGQQYGPGWFATTAVATAGLGLAVKGVLAMSPAVPVVSAAAGSAGVAASAGLAHGGGAVVAGSAGAGAAAASGVVGATGAGLGGSSLGIGVAAVTAVAAVGGGTAVVLHDDGHEPPPVAVTAQQTIRDVDLATLTWYDAISGARVTARDRRTEAKLSFNETRRTVDAPPKYSDVDGDGDEDAIASFTTAGGNFFQSVWYIWLWDADQAVARQLPDPIAESARCGDLVRSVTAVPDGGFAIAEAVRDPNGTESCAEEPPLRFTRTVRVVDGFPVLADPAGGYGGYCPQPSAGGDAGISSIADVGSPALHVTPSATSSAIDPARAELIGPVEAVQGWHTRADGRSPWTVRDRWALVHYWRPDDRVGPLPCAWISRDELTHRLGYRAGLP